ncbi:MAG TPA: hypothetical protein VM942_08565 [Acidimicrobiales bacterium]|nr:hypothetical protein [Acidimicrobiales bacterium]
MTNRVRMGLIVALILVLSLVACGGGEDPPSAAEDQARAEQMVLTAADLPGMTQGEEDDSDDEDDPIGDCLESPVLTELGNGPRSAESAFNDDEETQLRSSAVNLAESEDDAKEAFGQVKEAAFLTCFQDAVRSGFDDAIGQGLAVTNLSASNLPDASHGDESVTYRVTLDLGLQGQSVPASFDYMFIREGRVVAVLVSFDLNGSLDDAERGRLAELLSDRMQDA